MLKTMKRMLAMAALALAGVGVWAGAAGAAVLTQDQIIKVQTQALADYAVPTTLRRTVMFTHYTSQYCLGTTGDKLYGHNVNTGNWDLLATNGSGAWSRCGQFNMSLDLTNYDTIRLTPVYNSPDGYYWAIAAAGSMSTDGNNYCLWCSSTVNHTISWSVPSSGMFINQAKIAGCGNNTNCSFYLSGNTAYVDAYVNGAWQQVWQSSPPSIPLSYGATVSINMPAGTTAVRYRMSGTFETSWNLFIVPSILDYQPNSLTGTNGGLSWSREGRGYVSLSWPSVPFATGYKVWVWDGYAYRAFDVGNTTSWDSRTAKIYPTESLLNQYGIDTQTQNLFVYGGAGLDLRDSPTHLYQVTADGAYNSNPNYYFRVTAYSAGGGDTNLWYVPVYSTTLPDRTDTTPPAVTSVAINGGRDVAATSTVQLAVYASDDKSGVAALQLSNDGTAWTDVAYTNPVSWKLVPGEGARTVYVRACDQAGNCGNPKSGSVYLQWDSTLQSWINSSLAGTATGPATASQTSVAITSSSTDPTVTQVRWSTDGITWSPWEPLGEKRLAFQRDGVYNVAYQFRASNGDMSNVRYQQITVDTQAPAVKAGWVGNAIVVGSSNTARVWIEAGDNVTPVDQLQMSLDGGVTWVAFSEQATLYFNQDPAGTVLRKIRVRDQAGNVGQVALWIIKP